MKPYKSWKQWPIIKLPYLFLMILIRQYHLNLFKYVKDSIIFNKDYRKYKRRKENESFNISARYLYPCILDKTTNTPIEPIYFYQDTWCAGKIFKNKPKHHYDIGSKAEMVGIISEFVPTTMIDIRPVDVKLNNLFFQEGSILNLPFKDNSIKSLSSICVIEHIGLGRYGDPIEPYGSEKAILELSRVMKKEGNLYITVPVDEDNIVYFNAHRAFTRNYILKLFNNFTLAEEKYLYGNNLGDKYIKSKGFGTGFFHFIKK